LVSLPEKGQNIGLQKLTGRSKIEALVFRAATEMKGVIIGGITERSTYRDSHGKQSLGVIHI
jgi:hypothetical protein